MVPGVAAATVLGDRALASAHAASTGAADAGLTVVVAHDLTVLAVAEALGCRNGQLDVPFCGGIHVKRQPENGGRHAGTSSMTEVESHDAFDEGVLEQVKDSKTSKRSQTWAGIHTEHAADEERASGSAIGNVTYIAIGCF
eukprot:TRINITY_DN57895_c0_g1_i1.p1 TRINITY_DN57895_c0_g1~~TRINITY_DN57895_c0_g1_i1.p1  ORF type:complete len:160 (+),score=29.97 TRINITY_DN57895_c0_g1_i1:58-480(+)